ncbi:hypothetical protein [Microbulbifer sp. YPW1]|uniref:hypothetical protein n=1 Tax=Microbulbifer sp. YPW1 TaxID=2745199 RepID=UPI001599AFD9|nr:hypothetical protein [Microbulbifer sp. YPW1]QKX18568.1 hypothetical protein HUW35_17215 [Microbulbifer sp. YPW1]
MIAMLSSRVAVGLSQLMSAFRRVIDISSLLNTLDSHTDIGMNEGFSLDMFNGLVFGRIDIEGLEEELTFLLESFFTYCESAGCKMNSYENLLLMSLYAYSERVVGSATSSMDWIASAAADLDISDFDPKVISVLVHWLEVARAEVSPAEDSDTKSFEKFLDVLHKGDRSV